MIACLEDEFWAKIMAHFKGRLEFPGGQWYHIIVVAEARPNVTTTGCSE
jgi:hypothetical protein